MAVAMPGGGVERKRVVIIGGGFAGLHAALNLAKLPLDISLVDRRNHHTFQPLLYQVALAVLSPADIAQPIRSILRDYPNIEVLMDEAVAFHVDRAASRAEDGRSAGVRLSDRRDRLHALLLRPRRMVEAGAGTEDD